MSRTITIDGVDRTSVISRIGGRFTGKAHMGESSGSELILDDNAGAISHFDLAALKLITVDEDATASPTRILRGRLGSHAVERGDHVIGLARSWTLRPQDYNWDLRGFRILGWDRPAETDVERITALHAYFLNGSGSISPRKRTTTDLTTTYISASNPIDLEPKIYSDVDVADIFREIAELAGKDFFVTIDGEIFYDLPTSTAYAAGLAIDTDADGETVFAPLAGVVSAEHGGQEIMTGGALRYGDDLYVEGSDIWGGEGFHDKWEGVLFDAVVQTEAEARQLLEQIILVRSNEDLSYACTIGLRADQVDLVKYGQTLDFRHPATDVTGTKTLRVKQLQLEADAPGHYLAHLELGFPRVSAPRRPSRTPPVTKPVPSPPTPGGCTRLLDWSWEGGLQEPVPTIDSLGQPPTESPPDGFTGMTLNAGGWLEDDVGADSSELPGSDGTNQYMALAVVAGRSYHLEALIRIETSAGNTPAVALRWYSGSFGSYSFISATSSLATAPGSETFTPVEGDFVAPPGATAVAVVIGGNTWVHSVTLDECVDGDETQPVGGPGEGSTGTSPKYAPIDHVHEHGDVAGTGGTMHDLSQSTYDNAGSGLTASDGQAAIDELDDRVDTLEAGVGAHDHDGDYIEVANGGKETINVVAAAGSTETLDLADGNVHDVTLTDDCTLTLAGATNGVACSMTLLLRQDATGGRTVTWPGSVVWSGGSPPVLTPDANGVDVLTLFTLDGGTTWYAFPAGVGGSIVAALDDLTDVTITTPISSQDLRYDGAEWVNSSAVWRPLMDGAGAVVTDGVTGEAVMALS